MTGAPVPLRFDPNARVIRSTAANLPPASYSNVAGLAGRGGVRQHVRRMPSAGLARRTGVRRGLERPPRLRLLRPRSRDDAARQSGRFEGPGVSRRHRVPAQGESSLRRERIHSPPTPPRFARTRSTFTIRSFPRFFSRTTPMVIHSRSLARRISLLALSAAAPAIALAQASSPTMPPLNDLPNPYQHDTTVGQAARRSHVGLDERGRDRSRRQEHLGGRAMRREQLRRLDARPRDEVRRERQRRRALRRRHDRRAARHPRRQGRQHLGGRLRVHRRRRSSRWRRRRTSRSASSRSIGRRPRRRFDRSAKGHQIFKFSPDGKLLRTLGKPGGGRDPDYFFQPNAILVAPNGDIFVAEGHSSAPGSAARLFKFSKDGKLIKSVGPARQRPRRLRPAARAGDGFARAACSSATAATTGSRSSTRTASCSTRGTSSAARAESSSTRRTTSTSPIRSRSRSAAAALASGSAAFASAARRTAR